MTRRDYATSEATVSPTVAGASNLSVSKLWKNHSMDNHFHSTTMLGVGPHNPNCQDSSYRTHRPTHRTTTESIHSHSQQTNCSTVDHCGRRCCCTAGSVVGRGAGSELALRNSCTVCWCHHHHHLILTLNTLHYHSSRNKVGNIPLDCSHCSYLSRDKSSSLMGFVACSSS